VDYGNAGLLTFSSAEYLFLLLRKNSLLTCLLAKEILKTQVFSGVRCEKQQVIPVFPALIPADINNSGGVYAHIYPQ
jgi:hypothetical protein